MNHFLIIGAFFLTCCSGEDDTSIAEFGGSQGAILTLIANSGNGLNEPRDLAFNPLREGELWIVNYADDSTVIVNDAPGDSPSHQKLIDGYAVHFMAEVTAIDFGQTETTIGVPGTFATCGESINTYNGQLPEGNNFMGPALWSSDLSVYAAQNPHGLGSHLDMLHNTPLCMGITHESENKYWVVGGFTNSIERYDFAQDDGVGNDDHFDGKTWRYAAGEMGYVPGVPSHLDLDPNSSWLYIADPSKGQILRLDTLSGSEGSLIPGLETPIQSMEGALLEVFVSKEQGNFDQPSGLEVHNDHVFVSDRTQNKIAAYDMTGNLLDEIELDIPGAGLSGFTFGPDNKIYLVDTPGNRVFRLDPAE